MCMSQDTGHFPEDSLLVVCSERQTSVPSPAKAFAASLFTERSSLRMPLNGTYPGVFGCAGAAVSGLSGPPVQEHHHGEHAGPPLGD